MDRPVKEKHETEDLQDGSNMGTATGVGDSNPVQLASNPPSLVPSINIEAYPHLLRLIVESSSRNTLATLMRCSKSLFHITTPVLYTNLHISKEKFEETLAIGTLSTLGNAIGDQALTPSLRRCLHAVQTLHVTKPDIHFDGPIVRPAERSFSILPQLSTLVVHPNLRNPLSPLSDSTRHNAVITIPSFGSGHDSLRTFVRITPPPEYDPKPYIMIRLSGGKHNITVIYSYHPNFIYAPRQFYLTNLDNRRPDISATIVFPPPPREAARTAWTESGTGSMILTSNLLILSYFLASPPTIVGGDYFVDTPEEWARLREQAQREVTGKYQDSDRLTFLSLSEWLDQLEPGTVYTKEEEAELRETDRVAISGLKPKTEDSS